MKIAIIGYGRFGKLLFEILKNDFCVTVFEKEDALATLHEFQTVFLCVPIRAFASVIKTLSTYIAPNTTVIDTCSVKLHPVECMTRELPQTSNIIATHPLFGPDSYHQDTNNKMVMIKSRCNDDLYTTWKSYFEQQTINIIEMSADEHDRLAARSQGITHILGRALKKMEISKTPIDTLGFTRLLGIMDQTCNDSLELFEDLESYNPYTKAMIKSFKNSL